MKGAANFASAGRPGEPGRDKSDLAEAQGGGRGKDH